MKKYIIIFFVVTLAILIVAVSWLLHMRLNNNELWDIVDHQCVPNQQYQNAPAPCLSVNIEEQYVILKDQKGALHTLTMPTRQIKGIENPQLQQPYVPDLFHFAWNRRALLTGNMIPDEYLSIAVNSKYGRNQDQLHLHLACLRPDVYQILRAKQSQIGTSWQLLDAKIRKHSYLAIKVSEETLKKNTPFMILNSYVKQHKDDIGKYGLAMVVINKNDVILLANRLNLAEYNLGSIGEIQDYDCKLMHR